MFAPMCPQAHIIRVANIIRRSRHHLPKSSNCELWQTSFFRTILLCGASMPCILGALPSLAFRRASAEQSSAARLYEYRLARSRLSAPTHALRAAAQVAANLSFCAKKQKKTATLMGNCLFGAEGEIRTLAPVNPTYTLSRGASSTS